MISSRNDLLKICQDSHPKCQLIRFLYKHKGSFIFIRRHPMKREYDFYCVKASESFIINPLSWTEPVSPFLDHLFGLIILRPHIFREGSNIPLLAQVLIDLEKLSNKMQGFL